MLHAEATSLPLQRKISERGQLPFVVHMILFPVIALIFLLNCFVDREPVSSPFTKIEV